MPPRAETGAGSREDTSEVRPATSTAHQAPQEPRGPGRAATIGLFLLLAAWVAVFLASGSLQRGPNPRHLGGDFVLFLSGARVVEAGGNPFDQQVLYRAERRLLQRDHVRPPAFDPYMRVGNPPLLFWLLRPMTALSFDLAVKAWCALMYLLLAVGFAGCLVRLEWRRRLLPLLAFLLFPQTIYAAYYGNVDALVFAPLAWGAVLARRKPVIAGALLTCAFLKPQIALPAALIIGSFLAVDRARVAIGFIAATLVGLILTVLTTGAASVGWWLHALTGYSQRLGVQPDIASLSGLYVYSASDRVRVGLEALTLGAALAATVFWWWRERSRGPVPVLDVAWLWIVWFLATPFAHFHDEVMLALPVLALLGGDAERLGRAAPTLAVFVLLLSILLFPTSRAHTDLQSLTLLVALTCALVELRQHESLREAGAGVPTG